MIPRVPQDVNLTHQIGKAPGQERVIALEQAVKYHSQLDYSDTESVVDTAEKFHSFLAVDQG